jgi:copper homeostasis protein (lipoprotein)
MIGKALVLALGVALICGTATAQGQVTGSAFYRERIALPPGAVFEAVLEDISRADAPATEIARVERAEPGNPPFEFALDYDPETIDPRAVYSVRARVLVEGRLMFTSDTVVPVITRDNPDNVEIMMVRAGGTIETAPGVGAHGLRLPAHFTGDLPCADCPGIRHLLNLWPDQVFHLRRTYLERDLTLDTIGRWHADAGRAAIVLDDGSDERLEFEVRGDGRLRLLAQDGTPIESDLPYDLAGAEGIAPFDPRLGLRGMVTYFADSVRFTECLTGRSYPVAAEGDVVALQEAVLAGRPAPDTAVLATIEGQIAPRPRMEGIGNETSVVVERFISVSPGETCERAMSEAPLTDTYWRILSLGQTGVSAGDGRREPYLALRSSDGRYSATVGCNMLIGGFEQDGESLRFGLGASTMMACPPPLDGWERALADVLAVTARWRIIGQTLEFLDIDGAPVALFQAVYLP